MVIDNLNDPRKAPVLGFVNREHEPEPFVEPYRALALAIARQFLEVEGFDRIEVGLRVDVREDLHFLQECPEDITSEPGVILALCERPLQLRVSEPYVHAEDYNLISPFG